MVPCGGAAGEPLSASPLRCRCGPVYLTSGPNRRLRLCAQTVHLRHALRWQLVAPHRPAGNIVRALAWLGPQEVEEGLRRMPRISAGDLAELAEARAVLPAWLAGPGERADRSWLRFRSSPCRAATGATPSASPPARADTDRICSKWTSGLCRRWTLCFRRRSARTWSSREARLSRRPIKRSGVFPRISTSPTTSEPWPPISRVTAKIRCRPRAARNDAGRGPSRARLAAWTQEHALTAIEAGLTRTGFDAEVRAGR